MERSRESVEQMVARLEPLADAVGVVGPLGGEVVRSIAAAIHQPTSGALRCLDTGQHSVRDICRLHELHGASLALWAGLTGDAHQALTGMAHFKAAENFAKKSLQPSDAVRFLTRRADAALACGASVDAASAICEAKSGYQLATRIGKGKQPVPIARPLFGLLRCSASEGKFIEVADALRDLHDALTNGSADALVADELVHFEQHRLSARTTPFAWTPSPAGLRKLQKLLADTIHV